MPTSCNVTICSFYDDGVFEWPVPVAEDDIISYLTGPGPWFKRCRAFEASHYCFQGSTKY